MAKKHLKTLSKKIIKKIEVAELSRPLDIRFKKNQKKPKNTPSKTNFLIKEGVKTH